MAIKLGLEGNGRGTQTHSSKGQRLDSPVPSRGVYAAQGEQTSGQEQLRPWEVEEDDV